MVIKLHSLRKRCLLKPAEEVGLTRTVLIERVHRRCYHDPAGGEEAGGYRNDPRRRPNPNIRTRSRYHEAFSSALNSIVDYETLPDNIVGLHTAHA